MPRLSTNRFFRTEDVRDSVLSVPVGNVTPDMELSFEYGVRSKSDTGEREGVAPASLASLALWAWHL